MKKAFLTYIFILISTIATFAKLAECEGYYIRKGSKDKIKATLLIPILADEIVKENKKQTENNKDGFSLEKIGAEIYLERLQWRFKSLDEFSKADVMHYPKDIAEFGFNYKGVDYCFYSIENFLNVNDGYNGVKQKDNVFVHVVIKGPCKLFTCYKMRQMASYDGVKEVADLFHNNNHSARHLNNQQSVEIKSSISHLKTPAIRADGKPWFIFDKGVFNYNFKVDLADYFKDYPALASKISNGEYGKKDLEKIVQEYNQWKQKK